MAQLKRSLDKIRFRFQFNPTDFFSFLAISKQTENEWTRLAVEKIAVKFTGKFHFKSVDVTRTVTRYQLADIASNWEYFNGTSLYEDIFYCLRAGNPPLMLVFPAREATALRVPWNVSAKKFTRSVNEWFCLLKIFWLQINTIQFHLLNFLSSRSVDLNLNSI